MNKKDQMNKKILRQQEMVAGAKAAGRELTADEQSEFEDLQRDIDTLRGEIDAEEREALSQTETQRAILVERKRTSEITALCREFEIDPSEHIKSGASVDQVREIAMEKMITERRANPSSRGFVQYGEDEADKFREAASDALLIRSGRAIEKPADGARELRSMKLRDLAIECVVRKGGKNAHRLDDETLFREALTPDSQFSSILSNAVNKSMATAYRGANTTYQVWTGRGSNPDFKAATVYQISEAGELVPMSQSGEFKFDEMQDNGVTKALATFGREFGMTRQAFINDDIGILTKVPAGYVRATGRGINKLVYKMLGSNPVIYDGKVLFVADHGNLGTAGEPSVTTLGELRKLMRLQKNQRGLEALNINPSFIIAPAAHETNIEKLLWSPSDPASANSGVINPFSSARSSLTPVIDAELDGYSPYAYYVAAAPGDIDTIEVTYLNGDDMPKLESQIGFDFLGIKWRIYIDYGVTVLDYRGMAMNAGH